VVGNSRRGADHDATPPTMERPDLKDASPRDGRLRSSVIRSRWSRSTLKPRRQTLTLASFHAFQAAAISVTDASSSRASCPRPASRVHRRNVSASFPEGFKGTYEGRIAVAGTPKRAMVSGRIEVVRGLYSKDFDVGLFGGAQREFDAASESPFPRNIFLDVDIVAPGNVWLRNDVAAVEAEGQVHLGGELARPEVTGHFSLLPGGTVTYRDVDYRIEYGTIALTDPKRINPYLEFRGRTKVAEYEISLHIEGTLDKFDYELTSTPPLDSQDIISLLVTGRTLETLSGSASAAALPGDMAAYYFAGLLSSTFGKQIQSSLGIDQLAITPQLLKGESDPTARVTVGKQVSEAVKIAFSQDIGTAQRQTYSVAWDATRRIRLVVEDDTEVGFGGELQYSRQFGGTLIARERIEAGGSVQVVTENARPARTRQAGEAQDRPAARLDGCPGAIALCGLLKQGFIQSSVQPKRRPILTTGIHRSSICRGGTENLGRGR
jgi:hypothetical protein